MEERYDERRKSPWNWVLSIHTVIGVLSGSIVTLGAVLAFGGRVLKAPGVAAQALNVANAAAGLAADNKNQLAQLDRTLRVVFCTDPQFDLSGAAKIELRCYALTNPRRP